MTLYVKPAVAGAIIRDPVNLRPLPPEGAAVTDNTIWRRRLDRGEVTKTTAGDIALGKAKRESAEAQAVAETTETATAAEPAERSTKRTKE